MIGLDTNIVVRYIVQDDPVQSPQAAALIERLTEDDPGFISIVAMAETAWVLGSVYRFSDAEIAAAVENMLQVNTLVVQDEAAVFTAMTALKEGRGAFADALIGALGLRAGCPRTLTFDRRAARLPGFALL